MSNIIEVTINGVDHASGPLSKVNKALGSMVKAATKVAAAAAAAASATILFTKKVAEGEDRVAKFAKRIGVSVSQLSAWEAVADQAGLSTQQFDLAMQRMTRRVAEATDGMGEAQTALRDLGVNAKEFAQLPLSDQIFELNNRLGSMTDNSKKLALAFKLFDTEGTAVLQMLDGNNEALREQLELAQRYGVVLGKEAAANAEHFSDRMDQLGQAFLGISRAVADVFIPILSGVFHEIAEMVAGSRESVVAFIKDFIGRMITLGVISGQIFTSIKNFIAKSFSSAEGFNHFIDLAKQAFSSVFDFLLELLPAMVKSMIARWKLAWEAFTEIGKWAWQWIKSFFGGEEPIPLGNLLFETIPEATKDARKELEDAWNGLTTTLKDGAVNLSNFLSSALGINVELAQQTAKEIIDKLSEFGEADDQNLENRLSAHKSFLEELKSYYDDFITRQKDINYQLAQEFGELMMSTVQAIGDGVASVIVDGGKLMNVFKSIAKQVAKAIISTLIQIGVQRFVLSKIFSATVVKNTTQEATAAPPLAAANALKSMYGAPFPVNLTAPAVAAKAFAETSAFSAAAIGAATAGGAAHGGLEYVPREATFLLNKGERVLSPSQNADLTTFLKSGGGSTVVQNMTVSVLPNAVNADFITRMSAREIEDLVAEPVARAMESLSRRGQGRDFQTRGARV